MSKLVRDRIPELFGGQSRMLDKAEYRTALRQKLEEEVGEYLAADDAGELADVLEVVRALATLHGLSPDDLEALRARKAGERGGFEGRLWWEPLPF